jgi:Rrf2 family protein
LGFLESSVFELKHAGVLGSRPGVDGGFRLIKKPEQISLGSIIRALDGPLAPIPCVSKTAYQTCQDCPYAEAPQCPIKLPMLDVRNAIAGVLDHYTLKDFAQQIPGAQTMSEK